MILSWIINKIRTRKVEIVKQSEVKSDGFKISYYITINGYFACGYFLEESKAQEQFEAIVNNGGFFKKETVVESKKAIHTLEKR